MHEPPLPPLVLVGVAVTGPVRLVPAAHVMLLRAPFMPPAVPGL